MVIAAAGLVLGIRSEIRAHRHDRVRLRVTPKVSYPLGLTVPYEPRLAIEVINVGKFPVTVDEVGFEVKGTRHRFAITLPIVGDGKPWPRRLEPYDAVTAFADIDARLLQVLPKLKAAYADTVTGHKARGTSPALRHIAQLGSIPECPRSRSAASKPGYLHITDFAEDAR